MCVCVCVCVRARERGYMCISLWVKECLRKSYRYWHCYIFIILSAPGNTVFLSNRYFLMSRYQCCVLACLCCVLKWRVLSQFLCTVWQSIPTSIPPTVVAACVAASVHPVAGFLCWDCYDLKTLLLSLIIYFWANSISLFSAGFLWRKQP